MKRIKMAITTILATSALAVAGGDIMPADVEPVAMPASETTPEKNGWYAGLGYSYLNANVKGGGEDIDLDGHGIVLMGGYAFHPNLAVEGRYNTTLGDLEADNGVVSADVSDSSIDNWGIYLKPKYKVDKFCLYGLLGYGETTVELEGADDSESGFQWGLGGAYAINNDFSVFADYTRLHDDDETVGAVNYDTSIYAVNVGVAYRF